MLPYGWIPESERGLKKLFKRIIRRVLRWLIIPIHDELNQVYDNQGRLDAEAKQILKRLNAYETQWRQEDLRNKEKIESLSKRLDETTKNLSKKLDETTKNLSKKLDESARQSDDLSAAVAKAIVTYTREENITALPKAKDQIISSEDLADGKQDAYIAIDYFKFQNRFRGTRSLIKERQKIYLPYFVGKSSPVLDIGCGRGEFLELMKQNDIPAYGIDLYPEYIIEGQLHGIEIKCGDGIAYLNETKEHFGGIFIAQVVEHISFEQLQMLCRAAFERLEENAYLIIETPNPMCLSIYTSSFYIDPTHNKPVHPLMLQYLLEEIGFSEVKVLFTGAGEKPLPLIQSDAIKNLDQVNDAIKRISNVMFGSMDYAITAKKQKGRGIHADK